MGRLWCGDNMMYVLLISASIVWGINVLVMKVILEFVPIYFLAMLKVGFSLVSVGLIMKIKKATLTKIDYKVAFKVSLFALTINFALTFTGMAKLSGAGNAIMNALAPLVAMILAYFCLHQKIAKRQLLAILVACFGFLWSIEYDYHNLSLGHGLLLLGIISYCYANIIMQGNRSSENYLPFTFAYLGFGFIELLLLSLFFNSSAFFHIQQVSIWMWLLFILFSGVGFAYIQVVYLYSLKKIGSVKTSFFLSLNPVFTYIGSLLFLKEKLNLSLLLAFSLMVIAIIIANFQHQKKVQP